MKHKGCWPGIGALLGMLLLILDGKTALLGGQDGVRLCLGSVIPSLFPFLILSQIFLSWGGRIPGIQWVGKGFPISANARFLLLPAFLGGYPMGAKALAEAKKAGQISRQTAERMLAFCNNAGPAFLFGIAAAHFPHWWMGWALWAVQILSAWMTAWLFPTRESAERDTFQTRPVTLAQALPSAVSTMGVICGWVVLFRIFTAICQRWFLWLFPEPVQVIFIGLLELTNGCFALDAIDSLPLRFTVCSAMLAWGGICVAMQTRSVTQGLSMRYYLYGKLVQTGFSLLLCGCLFQGNIWLPVTLAAGVARMLLPCGKRSGILGKVGV